jgi:hypothetical protein
MFCENCGTKISDNVSFCPNCGSKTNDQPAKAVQQSVPGTGTSTGTSYRQPTTQQGGHYAQPQPQAPMYSGGQVFKKRTGWLTFVIVVNWISVGFIGLGIILFLFLYSEFEEEFAAEGMDISGALGITVFILLIVIGLIIWLTIQLGKFSNTARIISIIFSVIGLISGLATFNLFSIALQGLRLYALAFDKKTVALFQDKYQQPHYGY